MGSIGLAHFSSQKCPQGHLSVAWRFQRREKSVTKGVTPGHLKRRTDFPPPVNPWKSGPSGLGNEATSGNPFLDKMEQPPVPNPHLPDIMVKVSAEVALPEDGQN
jgi:hypothetical protein